MKTKNTPNDTPKRGRGRPKKVDSLEKTNKVKKQYEKRKSAYDIEFEKNELVKNQKSGKHKGYCPDCDIVIADFDIKDDKYFCNTCQKYGFISNLKEARARKEEWSSKREYLSRTVFDAGVFGSYHSGHNSEVESPESEDV